MPDARVGGRPEGLAAAVENGPVGLGAINRNAESVPADLGTPKLSEDGDGGARPFSVRCLTRKPLDVVHAEEDEEVLERTLGFWDLFSLSFGGTVGRCCYCIGATSRAYQEPRESFLISPIVVAV